MASVMAFVKGVFMGMGFGAATAATLATYTISTVVSYGLSYVATRLGNRGQENAVNNFESGITLNKIDPVAPIPVVYGRRLVGGPIVYRNLSDDNQIFYQALVLSEGQIDSIEATFLNDIPLQTSFNLYDELEPRTDELYEFSGMTKTIVDQEYIDLITSYQEKVNIELRDGRTDQDYSLILDANEDWSSAHKGSDVAYLAMSMTFDRDVFPNGVPQVTCDVKGVKVLDIRTGVVAWSDNPALCIYDYLTNERYGCGIPTNLIDEDSFTSAANYCDETVNFLNYTGDPIALKRYLCNGVIDVDDTCLNNLNKMLTSCRGMLIFSSGKYKLKIDKPETGTYFAFNDTNILGSWTITGASKRSIANKVTTRFFNAHDRFIESLSVVGSEDDIEKDNNQIHTHDIKLPFTSNPQRAEAMTAMHLKQTRQEWSCEFDATLDAIQVEVGDVVSITSTTTGYDAKPFRVVSMEMKTNDTIHFVCSEYDESVYTYDLTTPPSHPDTNLRPGFKPSIVNSLDVDTGTDSLLVSSAGVLITRARIFWKKPTDGFVRNYEVGYKLSTQTDEQWTMYVTTSTEHYIQPLSDGENYDFKVRAIGTNGKAGEWNYLYNVEAIGKTQPPDNVTNFTFDEDRRYTQIMRWDEVDDLDLAGYEIRYSGTTSVWENMKKLHNSLVKINPFETTLLAEGTYNLAIKAVDTSGNSSTNANVISITITDDPAVTIFRQDFPHLDNWINGEFFDSYVYDGSIIPQDRKSWNDFPTDSVDWDAWTQWIRDPHETRFYYEVDLGLDKTFRPIVKSLGDGTIDIKVGIAPDQSANFIESPGFDDATKWTFQSNGSATNGNVADAANSDGWTIAGGKATCGGLINSCRVRQNNVFGGSPYNASNRTFTVTFTISDYVSGSVRVNVGGYNSGTYRSANGTYTENIIVDNSSASDNVMFRANSSNSFEGVIDDIIVTEVIEDRYDISAGNFDQKFYPAGLNVKYSNGTSQEHAWYLEMADGGYISNDGKVNVTNLSNAAYHTLASAPSWTALDSGASPVSHIYYIEDLGAGNNNSAWDDILDQTTTGAWIIDRSNGDLYYYKTDYSQSLPPSGITWITHNGSIDVTEVEIKNGFTGNGNTSTNLYSPTNNSGDLVTGRYVSFLITASAGLNILRTLSILFDGKQVEEMREITVTPTSTTSDSFTFTVVENFVKITNVQVTPEQEFVSAQVTNIDQDNGILTINYNKTSGTFSGDQSFFIIVKGY